MNRILPGDCLRVLPTLQADTFDALVTDPPASISFMGQAWDGDRGGRQCWVSWLAQVMREALRVLKPGAHGLVWAIPRRSHWTALALEDAGFEVRDCIHHYFLTGFPKNVSVDKAIDKKLGKKRKVIGIRTLRDYRGHDIYMNPELKSKRMEYAYTEPASLEAKQWEGWGTHLKPAIEQWWLVRKPLSEKTIVANVLKWGTGALNIEASRIPVPNEKGNYNHTAPGTFAGRLKRPAPKVPLAESVGEEYQGKPRPADVHPDSRYPSHFIVSDWELLDDHTEFFHPPIYSPKARRCRSEANHHPTVKPLELMKYFITLLTRRGGHVLDCFAGSFTTGVAAQQLGLNFTGIEENAKYVQIGMKRLSA